MKRARFEDIRVICYLFLNFELCWLENIVVSRVQNIYIYRLIFINFLFGISKIRNRLLILRNIRFSCEMELKESKNWCSLRLKERAKTYEFRVKKYRVPFVNLIFYSSSFLFVLLLLTRIVNIFYALFCVMFNHARC